MPLKFPEEDVVVTDDEEHAEDGEGDQLQLLDKFVKIDDNI